MKRVVTFGEIMLRLQPDNNLRFVQADHLEATFGGAEANVAVSLAGFGIDSVYVTKLPQHEIGQAAVCALRKYGVDTSKIVRGGDRVGIYFNEKGAGVRGSKCIYDRAHSAISEAAPDDFDWQEIFKGADWFHFTGITPALSDNCAQITLLAAKEASKMGLTVSCDLNYRSKLWSCEKAGSVMDEICKYVDICICNEEDAEKVFGIKAEGSNVTKGIVESDSYLEVAKELLSRFGLKAAAITLRESISASDNNFSGVLYTNNEMFSSKKYSLHIVDRVGGGDAFSAGLIYGYLQGYDPGKALDFAVCAAALKHSIEGDFNLVSVSEVNKLSEGDSSGRIVR